MGRRKYFTDEERKEARKAYDAARYKKNKKEILAKQTAYNAAHKEEKAAYDAAHYKKNKEEILAKQTEYHATPFGRARNLVGAYRKKDKKYNRGECTLTPQWVVDNVFSGQCCVYCGESDWHLLGCDRKDNNLPHTPENCVPCCCDCNKKKYTTPYDDFMRRIGKIA